MTKLELTLVLALVSALALVFLTRVQKVQEDAERTEVDLTVRSIRVGIQLAIGEHLIRGQESRIEEVAAASPFAFVDPCPPGLRTDISNPQRAGEWTYDAVRREVAYRPRLPAAFGGEEEMRWRYQRLTDALGRPTGIGLAPITP